MSKPVASEPHIASLRAGLLAACMVVSLSFVFAFMFSGQEAENVAHGESPPAGG